MKHILFLLLAILLFQCRETDSSAPYTIEGHWVDMTGTFAPDWHYHFDNGLLFQSYVKAGGTLTTLTYPYAIRDSVVIIGGDATNAPREWTLHWECEDVVQVTQSAQVLSQRFWLKRE